MATGHIHRFLLPSTKWKASIFLAAESICVNIEDSQVGGFSQWTGGDTAYYFFKLRYSLIKNFSFRHHLVGADLAPILFHFDFLRQGFHSPGWSWTSCCCFSHSPQVAEHYYWCEPSSCWASAPNEMEDAKTGPWSCCSRDPGSHICLRSPLRTYSPWRTDLCTWDHGNGRQA